MGVEKQSNIEKVAFEKRADINNEYDKENNYLESYSDVLENSDLATEGEKERNTAKPKYTVEIENGHKGPNYLDKYEETLKNSDLVKVGEKKRADGDSGYKVEIENGHTGYDYYNDYENILKNSKIVKSSAYFRHNTDSGYEIDFENDYDGYNYYEDYETILKNSRLVQEGVEARETSHPEYHLEIEDEKTSQIDVTDSIKKGDPEDGGHVHSIPYYSYNTHAVLPQLQTYKGGDEVDVNQRERLSNINRYSRVNAYGPGSIDTSLNEMDGQYFIP